MSRAASLSHSASILTSGKAASSRRRRAFVRLLPIAERASKLFGEEDAAAISRRIEQDVKASRNYSFAFMQDEAAAPEIKSRGRGRKSATGKAAPSAEAPAPRRSPRWTACMPPCCCSAAVRRTACGRC